MKKACLLAVALCPLSAMAAETAQTPDKLSLGLAMDKGLSAVAELGNQYRFTVGNEGGAFDYILTRGSFDANVPFTWYVGVGGYVDWDDNDDFGARVPLGLNWQVSKGWDVYGQIHPELNLYSGPELQLGGAVGVKYTF